MKYNSDRLLTTAEAARFLRVSQASVRRWSDAGLLRARRVGGRGERRFSENDLVVFLNAGVRGRPAAGTDTAVNVGGVPLAVPAHVATFFSTDTGGLRLTVPFFVEGLRLGQPCFLAASGTTLDRYMEALSRQRDVNFERSVAEGEYKVMKFQTGTAAGAVAEWEDAFARVLARKPAVIRIAGEMSSVRAMFISEEEMLRFEEALEVMYKRYPVVVICQYDVRDFTGLALLRALKAHPDMFGLRTGT
ncbi:MAG TPA: MEDS domain-containing protein, partial [Candidatus Dormibacteraeota bacterium]|nr:MEDS domain-containing protein [Candidatus Dormibacteraeota bacterium]